MKNLLFEFLSSPSISIILRKIVENNFRKQKKIIKKYFLIASKDRLLDIGCGTGEFSVFFSSEGYTGVDINPANIRYASSHYKRKFLVADGKKLPFPDNSFSKVLVVGVFHHLSDIDSQKVINEIKRVLKPDGKFLVMEDTESDNCITTLMHRLDQGKFIRSKLEWWKMFENDYLVENNFTFKNSICFYSAFLLSQKNAN